jgi:hypothetical protein
MKRVNTVPKDALQFLDGRQLRRFGIPAEARITISELTSDRPIKAHRDYGAAKSGDPAAAVRLVRDLIKSETLDAARQRFGQVAIYVPVIAVEQSGHNAIPFMLAHHFASSIGSRVAEDIMQVNRAHHTGARAMERVAVRAVFDGPVEKNGRYVLVDDVTVMGSTLADLANHIQVNGGKVVGAVTLANAGRSGVLTAPQALVRQIEERFGDAIREIFGIEPASLTADEAAYIFNFRDADAIRARFAAALRERVERLRAKGILADEDDGEEVG